MSLVCSFSLLATLATLASKLLNISFQASLCLPHVESPPQEASFNVSLKLTYALFYHNKGFL